MVEAAASLAVRLQSPWRDRRGRLSWLKAATLALVSVPGLWLAWKYVAGEVGPRPLVFLIYHSGVWATWILLLSLAVTPARYLLGWSQLITVRRMVGVAGLTYTVIHTIIYLALDRFDWAFIANEIATRLTIIVAIASTVGLVALGATSFDAAIRKMGTRAWNQLHYVAYPAIGLAVLHWDLSPGSVGGVPFLASGMFIWLMGWRVLHRFDKGRDPLALSGLAVASSAATFVFEIAWLAWWQAIPPAETISFAFDLALGPDPAWCMLIIGFAVAIAAALFSNRSEGSPRLVLRRATRGY